MPPGDQEGPPPSAYRVTPQKTVSGSLGGLGDLLAQVRDTERYGIHLTSKAETQTSNTKGMFVATTIFPTDLSHSISFTS